MTDPYELLADAVRRRRARPWLHVTSDGQAHFYLRTTSHSPDDVDVAAFAMAGSAAPTHRDEAGNEWITPAEDMWQDDDGRA